jgi:hypothetical protein
MTPYQQWLERVQHRYCHEITLPEGVAHICTAFPPVDWERDS